MGRIENARVKSEQDQKCWSRKGTGAKSARVNVGNVANLHHHQTYRTSHTSILSATCYCRQLSLLNIPNYFPSIQSGPTSLSPTQMTQTNPTYYLIINIRIVARVLSPFQSHLANPLLPNYNLPCNLPRYQLTDPRDKETLSSLGPPSPQNPPSKCKRQGKTRTRTPTNASGYHGVFDARETSGRR